MLTIMAAMEQELAGLRRELRQLAADGPRPYLTEEMRRNGGYASHYVSPPIELWALGVGKELAQANFRSWLGSRGGSTAGGSPDEVLLLGFAGAVDPALRAGELVLPSRYYQGSIDSRPSAIESKKADQELSKLASEAAAQSGMRLTHSDSLTVGRVVATPEGKRAIRSQYPVGIVDMEDYWLAGEAAKAGIHFLAVRAVVDTASQALPPYVLALAGHPARAVASVVVHPWQLPALLKLRNQMRLAQKNLTRFALSFLAMLPSDAQRQSMLVG